MKIKQRTSIDQAEWDKVSDLAADIANLHLNNEDADDSNERAQLLNELYELRKKYGDKPEIIATIGDYHPDPIRKLAYLATAFVIALAEDDSFNRCVIADSLADTLAACVPNDSLADHWYRIEE
jgi:hypothetical protein